MIDSLVDVLKNIWFWFRPDPQRLCDGNKGEYIGLSLIVDNLSDKMPKIDDIRYGVLIVGVLVVELGEFEVGLSKELDIFVW